MAEGSAATKSRRSKFGRKRSVEFQCLAAAPPEVIKEQSLSNIFKRLDQMIGLASVKLAMREFYATVVPTLAFREEMSKRRKQDMAMNF